MNLVSVIVPVYNVEPYLNKCVQSIVRQDHPQLEILLVDDGSTDRSGLMCDEWAARDSRIQVIHKKNGGQSEARNVGLGIAKGDLIAFVDSDDELEPDNIRTLSELLSRYEEADIAQGNHYTHRNGKTKLEYAASPEGFMTRADAFRAVLYHDRVDVGPCNKLFRRKVFETLRFPEGRIYEDTALFGKLLSESSGFVYCGRPLYHYFVREGSTVHGGFDEKRLGYISAVQELNQAAMQTDSRLEEACTRRITHAYLSVLRYMEHCEAGDRALRDDLRMKALQNSAAVIGNASAPKRDKLALRLLKLGYLPFYASWRLYGKLRP
ncbi:MAG: glycosyltransferase family 2 protein [Clostridia bacterium]|nr:glycosyltransferase family 2 protein [Clostridia bacterium]